MGRGSLRIYYSEIHNLSQSQPISIYEPKMTYLFLDYILHILTLVIPCIRVFIRVSNIKLTSLL